MKLYHNKETNILSLVPGATSSIARILAQRTEDFILELIPTQADGTVELYHPTASGVLVVKTKGDYKGAAKLLDSGWDAPNIAGSGYNFGFYIAGVGIDSALDAAGAKPITCALQMVVTEPGKRRVLPAVDFEISNNYWREDDVPADPENPYPLPDDVLTKTAQALTNPQQSQVRTNIGLAGMAMRESVAVPANESSPGLPGYFSVQGSTLYLYVGNGVVHTWIAFEGATAFFNE